MWAYHHWASLGSSLYCKFYLEIFCDEGVFCSDLTSFFSLIYVMFRARSLGFDPTCVFSSALCFS